MKTKTNLDNLLDLTFSNRGNNLDLIVWPETAVLFNIQSNNKYNTILRENLKNINNIVLGTIRRESFVKENKIYNSLFLISNKSNYIKFHDKIKLVPFGEFIPFRNILKYKNITLGGIDISNGKEFRLLELKSGIKILPLICYEVIFPKITKPESNDYN